VTIDEYIHGVLLSAIGLFIKSPLTPATSEVGGTLFAIEIGLTPTRSARRSAVRKFVAFLSQNIADCAGFADSVD
jgi:hypothetical protein